MNTYEELLNEHGLVDNQVGVNSNGETIIVNIDEECAWIKTLQKDKRWHRVNVFWRDGTEEEYYE